MLLSLYLLAMLLCWLGQMFVEINLAAQGGVLLDYETSLFTNAKHTFIVSVFHR